MHKTHKSPSQKAGIRVFTDTKSPAESELGDIFIYFMQKGAICQDICHFTKTGLFRGNSVAYMDAEMRARGVEPPHHYLSFLSKAA